MQFGFKPENLVIQSRIDDGVTHSTAFDIPATPEGMP
jgi:hypothetical protein